MSILRAHKKELSMVSFGMWYIEWVVVGYPSSIHMHNFAPPEHLNMGQQLPDCMSQ